MINRRRPIQSIVAGRKMFSNGGVVPPPMGAPPMGAPPMGAPPMGILNSSPELAQAASFSQPPPTLVDSMVNEGTAGYGQGLQDSTAMNAAPVPMAQGGLASEDMMAKGFFNGGVQYGINPRNPPRALGAGVRSSRPSPYTPRRGPVSISADDIGMAYAAGEGIPSKTSSLMKWLGSPALGEAPKTPSLVDALAEASGPNYSVGSIGGPEGDVGRRVPIYNPESYVGGEIVGVEQPSSGSSDPTQAEQLSSDPVQIARVFDDPKLDFTVPAIDSRSNDLKAIPLNYLLGESKEAASERWMSTGPLDTELRPGESRAGMGARVSVGVLGDAIDTIAIGFSNALKSVFGADFAQKYTDFDLGSLATVTAEMEKRHPDLAEEIRELATRIISRDPEIDAIDLKGMVSKALSNKYEIGPHTDVVNQVAEEQAKFRDEGLADETGKIKPFTEEEIKERFDYGPGDETEGPIPLSPEEIEQQFGTASGLADETGMPIPRSEAEMDEIRQQEAARAAARAEAARAAETEEFGTALTEAEEFADDEDYAAMVERMYQDDLLMDAPTTANTIEQNKALLRNISASRKKADAQFNKTKLSKSDARNTLEQHISDFKGAMPEYEGSTSFEDGMAILEAGLKIMAGKSPHAIENISKGAQGLFDRIAKNAKEKRAYDRQIGLSAAKYGLEAQRADIAQDRADRRQIWFFYDQTKKDKDNPYGTLVPVSRADLFANGGKLPPGLVDKDLVSKTIVSANANAKILKKSLTTAVTNYQIGDKEADRYVKSLSKAQKALVQSESGIALLGLAKARIAAENLGSFGAGFNELLRRTATGINMPWAKRFTKGKYTNISQARSDVNIALQELIKASLGSTQAANSISNKDVKLLADAYVDSAFTEKGVWNFFGMDMNALGGRLDKAIGVFRERQQDSLRTYDRVQARLEKMESAIARGQKAGLVVDQGPFDRSQFDPYLSAMKPYVSKLRSKGKVPQQNIVVGKSLTTPTGSFVFKDGKYNFTPKSN